MRVLLLCRSRDVHCNVSLFPDMNIFLKLTNKKKSSLQFSFYLKIMYSYFTLKIVWFFSAILDHNSLRIFFINKHIMLYFAENIFMKLIYFSRRNWTDIIFFCVPRCQAQSWLWGVDYHKSSEAFLPLLFPEIKTSLILCSAIF